MPSNNQSHNTFIIRLINFSKFGCLIVTVLSLLVLLGWLMNVAFLKSVLPGYTSMNPIEAFCFIAVSAALLLRIDRLYLSKSRLIIINILSSLILLVGFLILLKTFTGYDLGVDKILFAGSLGRSLIAPNTAFNFILIGASLLAFNKEIYKSFGRTQLFTLATGIITMFAGIGYLYNALSFYQLSTFSPMPLNTVLAFALLCFCILISTYNYGMMKILSEQLEVSTLARRLIMAAIILPVILGLLSTVGQEFNLFDTKNGNALMVVAQIIIFTILIWITTNILYQDELEKAQLSETLKQKNFNLEQTGHKLTQNLKELEDAHKKIQDLLLYQGKVQDHDT